MYVAKLVTNANGRNYSFDDSIRFLLDSGLAAGKTDKSVEGFKGRDFLTRAEAVTFIKNLKSKQDLLYPSPTFEYAYDPTTLKLSPFENFPLVIDQPPNDQKESYSKVTFTAPSAGYTVVHSPSYRIEGKVDHGVGDALSIQLEYWDSGFFKPVTNITTSIKSGKLSLPIDLPKTGVYRVTVKSEYERDGKKMDQNMTLTSFYVEYKAVHSDLKLMDPNEERVRVGDLKLTYSNGKTFINGKIQVIKGGAEQNTVRGEKLNFYDLQNQLLAEVPITDSETHSNVEVKNNEIKEFTISTFGDITHYSNVTLTVGLLNEIKNIRPPGQ
ncbi:hypothetical protein ACFQZT_11530 [Paenibacillus sp. GCM10027628]|uniref:hypothetical protein n=1 Tax=Paenibacillus sp. GCM10027628 TaxID=3273413 RepID=UPI003643606B